jgi:hypothetical protein
MVGLGRWKSPHTWADSEGDVVVLRVVKTDEDVFGLVRRHRDVPVRITKLTVLLISHNHCTLLSDIAIDIEHNNLAI